MDEIQEDSKQDAIDGPEWDKMVNDLKNLKDAIKYLIDKENKLAETIEESKNND